jgi:hypothetical protein
MLGWLGKLGLGKKSTSPLGSSQALKDIIADLSPTPVKAIAEITEWLAMADQPDLRPQDRLTAIRTLDEIGSRYLGAIVQEFVTLPPTHHRAEQCWLLATGYLDAVGQACREGLYDLFGEGGPLERDKGSANWMAARAMAAMTQRHKLARMRYRAVDATMWGEYFRTVETARRIGVANRSQKLQEPDEETSVQRELQVGTWFELAPIGSIDHIQMEFLDRVIRENVGAFLTRDTPSAETPFILDMSVAGPPRRIREDDPTGQHPSRLFLAPGQAYVQLIALARDVRRMKALPRYATIPGITGAVAVTSFLGLIEKLVLYWGRNPPRRGHERIRRREKLQVVHGYREVRRVIAGLAYLRYREKQIAAGEDPDSSIDEFTRYGFVSEARNEELTPEAKLERTRKLIEDTDRQVISEWLLSDLSASGCGATALGGNAWLQVGILLGLRWGTQPDWNVGIVRRLARDSKGQAAVGVQRYPGLPQVARIGSLAERQVSVFERSYDPGVSVYYDAIALVDDHCVLIEPNVYSEGALFRLVIQEEKTTIKLIEVVEHGMNFDRVRYVEVVEGEEDEVESTSASAPPRRSALPTSGSARTMPPPSTRTVPPAPRKTMPPGR